MSLARPRGLYAPSFSLSAPCILLTLTHRLRFISNPYFDTPSSGAESEGFEPPEARASTVFKTAAIDHSANFPKNEGRPDAFGACRKSLDWSLCLKKGCTAAQR